MPTYFPRALREVRSACFPLSLEIFEYLIFIEQPIANPPR